MHTQRRAFQAVLAELEATDAALRGGELAAREEKTRATAGPFG